MRAAFILLLVVLVAGCRRPSYDTSTPEATLDSAVEMVRRGDARSLPSIIEIPARDIAFAAYKDWLDAERMVINVACLYREFSGGRIVTAMEDIFAWMYRLRKDLAARGRH